MSAGYVAAVLLFTALVFLWAVLILPWTVLSYKKKDKGHLSDRHMFYLFLQTAIGSVLIISISYGLTTFI